MRKERLGDDVVVLRRWRLDDADWYAETAAHDPLIRRFASRSVAERAGYRRAPDLDRDREVKGQTWPTVGYVRAAGSAPSTADPN